jgi:hypothetical protein
MHAVPVVMIALVVLCRGTRFSVHNARQYVPGASMYVSDKRGSTCSIRVATMHLLRSVLCFCFVLMRETERRWKSSAQAQHSLTATGPSAELDSVHLLPVIALASSLK